MQEGNGGGVRLMSFNVRFDTVADAPLGNRWDDRVASVIETVRRFDPDVVGFQEALRTQLRALTDAFPDLRGVGKPREAGDVGEYVPLFFRRSRFELEDGGDFWLSPTPDAEGSLGWDAKNPRHCTWVRLVDGRAGNRFAVFNTHLDRWGELARLEAARLIVAELAVAPGTPTIVMGDLNAQEDSDPLATFRDAGFRDTFRAVHPDATDVQTVHHYVGLSGTSKIDYVLCDAAWTVLDADIIREPAGGRLPSDHYPVVAEVRLDRMD